MSEPLGYFPRKVESTFPVPDDKVVPDDTFNHDDCLRPEPRVVLRHQLIEWQPKPEAEQSMWDEEMSVFSRLIMWTLGGVFAALCVALVASAAFTVYNMFFSGL